MKPAKGIEKWGRDTARERYSMGTQNLEGPTTGQKPQDPIDQRGKNYENDSSGWVRGEGKKSPYPTFDRGREGKP